MKSKHISSLIRKLYCELEHIEQAHEELTDTDVREAIHLTLNYYFVWDKKNDPFPISFGMFSKEGNIAVGSVITTFLDEVNRCSELESFSVGPSRLDLLQDPDILTTNGHMYDELIGHVDTPLPPDPLPFNLFEEETY